MSPAGSILGGINPEWSLVKVAEEMQIVKPFSSIFLWQPKFPLSFSALGDANGLLHHQRCIIVTRGKKKKFRPSAAPCQYERKEGQFVPELEKKRKCSNGHSKGEISRLDLNSEAQESDFCIQEIYDQSVVSSVQTALQYP